MAAAQEDFQARADELEALTAIYGGALEVSPDGSAATVTLPDPGSQPQLVLRLHLPEAYPSSVPPIFELHSDYAPVGVLAEWAVELEAAFVPGEVVLFTWIEALRERWEELTAARRRQEEAAAAAAQAAEGEEADEVAEADALSDALRQSTLQDGGGGLGPELRQAMAEVLPTVVHGEPFTEKRSTFQAHLAPANSMLEVEAFMEILLQSNKIRAATHNIMAYRIERPAAAEGVAPTFLQDFDDDGEDAAGGRLLHLLQLADVRNCVVVVSRWYGGILLGPARFAHINNAARQLLEGCGFIGGGEGDGSSGKKKGSSGGRRR